MKLCTVPLRTSVNDHPLGHTIKWIKK